MKKINRVVLFGDSFIQGTGCFHELMSDGKMVYNKFEENRDKRLRNFQNEESWGKNIKKYYPNIEVLNYGLDGYSNYESFTELNIYLKNDYKDTDLILFGFTSKFRDFSKSQKFVWSIEPNSGFLHDDNPIINNPLAWEKDDYYLNKNYFALKGYNEYDNSKEEQKLTKKFILDYTNFIHNDIHLDYIAKTNYLFLQHWVETYDINFHCFDLFENYVFGNIGNFSINNKIYINYNNHRNESLLNFLIQEESENPLEYDTPMKVSYFEANNSFENVENIRNTNLVHPNQFGYEKIVDKIYLDVLSKKYK